MVKSDIRIRFHPYPIRIHPYARARLRAPGDPTPARAGGAGPGARQRPDTRARGGGAERTEEESVVHACLHGKEKLRATPTDYFFFFSTFSQYRRLMLKKHISAD